MATPIETLSPEDEMAEAFRVFDTDGDGFISKVTLSVKISLLLHIFPFELFWRITE